MNLTFDKQKSLFNTLKPISQNDHRFVNDIIKNMFLNEQYILIDISLKFVP